MPLHKLQKQIDKCKHPNSRKTRKLGQNIKKMNNREKQKMGHAVKSNMIGEKLLWFTEKAEPYSEPLSAEVFKSLITEYLARFDEELEQIQMKKSISKNRAHQHFSRESVIRMTKEREENEFNTGGIEMMDLCDADSFKSFKNWTGNSVHIQNLALKKISKTYINSLNSNAMVAE